MKRKNPIAFRLISNLKAAKTEFKKYPFGTDGSIWVAALGIDLSLTFHPDGSVLGYRLYRSIQAPGLRPRITVYPVDLSDLGSKLLRFGLITEPVAVQIFDLSREGKLIPLQIFSAAAA
jgi:hypothetical protein